MPDGSRGSHGLHGLGFGVGTARGAAPPCDDSPDVTYSGAPFPDRHLPQLTPFQFRRIDALLLLMAIIWGTNYSVVKARVRRARPPGVQRRPPDDRVGRVPGDHRRDAMASTAVFGAGRIARQHLLHACRRSRGGDWLALAGLGVVGHFLYQATFVAGLAQTSVANSSLHARGDAGHHRAHHGRTWPGPDRSRCIGPGPRSR